MADPVTDAPAQPRRHSCPACTILDAEDGSADGQLFTPPEHHVKNENQVWQSVLRTQDHVADKVTNFAGSLRFVYLHSVWFFIWVVLNIGVLGAALEVRPVPVRPAHDDRQPRGHLPLDVRDGEPEPPVGPGRPAGQARLRDEPAGRDLGRAHRRRASGSTTITSSVW